MPAPLQSNFSSIPELFRTSDHKITFICSHFLHKSISKYQLLLLNKLNCRILKLKVIHSLMNVWIPVESVYAPYLSLACNYESNLIRASQAPILVPFCSFYFRPSSPFLAGRQRSDASHRTNFKSSKDLPIALTLYGDDKDQ